MSRRAATLTTLVVSLAVLAGIPAAWAWSREPARVGSWQEPAPAASPTSSVAPPTPTQAALPPASTPARPPEPVRLTVASVGVSVAVRPVGVAPDGQVEIPADARLAGWYRFGPAPGSSEGSAVLVGHRDSRTQGRGGFYPLGQVRPGAEVLVTRADGSVVTYRVVERQRLAKAVLPTESLFAREGAPRLTLITCGGAYLPDRGGYQDNVVVTALPVAGGGSGG